MPKKQTTGKLSWNGNEAFVELSFPEFQIMLQNAPVTAPVNTTIGVFNADTVEVTQGAEGILRNSLVHEIPNGKELKKLILWTKLGPVL